KKQRHLHEDTPHMEDEKVRDGEANHERDGPPDKRVRDRLRVQCIRQGRSEHLGVVGEDERGNDVELVEVEEAHHHDQHQGNSEEDDQDHGERRHQQIRSARDARRSERLRSHGLQRVTGEAKNRPAGPHLPQAATNSFHLRTMYRLSSISVFQHATLPIRSQKAPPSRFWPAFSIKFPKGSLISFLAALPSYQYPHSSSVRNFLAVSGTEL